MKSVILKNALSKQVIREYNTIRRDNIAQIVILSNLFYHAEDFSTIVTIHTSGFERVR